LDIGNGSNPGLYSSTASYRIPSSSTTLVAGTEGFGIQASSGTATIASTYNQTGNVVGGLQLTYQTLASNTGPVTSETVTITHKAAISALTVAGSDYQDTLTYRITAKF
jgi:hypothetical protein